MRVCSFCQRCYDEWEVCCTEDGHPLSETRGGGPEMVSGYRLDLLLSSGVKGDLYRAHQTACGRSCLISIHSPDAATVKTFLDEANIAAAMFHPNIADVYEAGTLESGECFVVAEDTEYETLRDRTRTTGTPRLLDAIGLVRQTAEALHALHSNGLTHRAVRPENIVLANDADGQPLIKLQNIDFAGVTEHSIISDKFLIDSAIDSLRYYAPEQCSGEPVDAKADLYGLGIVLYEMLAGTPPFDASAAAGVIEKHRNHRPPDIRIDNFELRMLITHTLMESLHKRPDKRQSSANAFARQLRHIEQLATHVSTPPPAVAALSARPRNLDRVRSAEGAEAIRKIEHDAPRETLPQVSAPLPTSSVVENLGAAIANFVQEKSAPAVSHFSRLKQRRKKQPAKPESEAPPEPRNTKVRTDRRILSAEAAAANRETETRAVERTRSKKQPRRIEWTQPEDDIPSLADFPEIECTGPAIPTAELTPEPLALRHERKVEVPRPSELETMTVVEEPRPELVAIEKAAVAPLPDLASIPVIEASEETQTETQPEPPMVVATKPDQRKTAAVIAKPEPQKTSPEIQNPKKAQAVSANIGPVFQLRPRGIRISGLQNRHVPVAVAEPEEITLVSPARSRFRVNLDGSQPVRKRTPARRVVPLPSNDTVFFPTLLDARKTAGLESAPGGSILSTDAAAQPGRSIPFRSLTIGTGFLTLIAFFLFAGDSVWKSTAIETAGDPVLAKPPQAKEPAPIAIPAAISLPSAGKAPKIVEKPAVKNEDDTAKNSAPTVGRIASTTDRQETSDRSTVKAQPSTPARPIIVGSGKKEAKLESERRGSDKAPPPTGTNGATRPRIVKEPER